MSWCNSHKGVLMLVPVLSMAVAWVDAAGENVLSDQQAYCAYVTEQARAQSDFLRSPTALGAFTQPETGLPQQLVAGTQLSLANLKKAGRTEETARKNCELYKTSTAVVQVIQYALPSIEKNALHHRLELIVAADKSLNDLTEKTARMVEAQNMTRPMLWELKSTRIKLEADQADAQSKIAAIYTPPLPDAPLKEQVAAKQAGDMEEQRAQAKLTRQNNWDVALTVGTHQQINPLSQGVEPYGEVTVSYNLGSHAIDKHLDRSVTDFGDWKRVQESDVARGMEVLQAQVQDQIAAQETRLKALQGENAEVEKNLHEIGDAETTAALDFRNQLTTTQLLLGIEIGDATYRLDSLREFLKKNF